MIFTKQEILLNRSVTELLGWDERQQDGVNILYSDFFPVIVNKKALIAINENLNQFNKSSYMTFRPAINGRHVQLLIDYMYMNDDDVIAEIVSIKKDDGTYEAVIRDEDGDDVLVTSGNTETEAKFKLFIQYYLEEDCTKELEIIRKNEEKNKKFLQAKKEKEQAKNPKKKGRK